MDPLEAAWQAFRADPRQAGAFAAVAFPLVMARLPPDPREPHRAATAAADAALDLLRHPHRFDPARGTLLNYLVLSARGDFKNAQRAESRHQSGRVGVELDLPDRKEEYEPPSTLADHPHLRPVLDGLSAVERAVLDLMRAGERQTAAFAAVLGLADRPTAEQRLRVKRARDRIIARLKRAKGGP
jgi:hypothetical protein